MESPQPATEAEREFSAVAEISRRMVGLYKEQFGRGPVKVRTNYAGPDTVICTLEQSMTPAEKNMVKMGELQRLRDVRLFFQNATEEQFRAAVEEVLGRQVRGFISGMDVLRDISCEVFYLEPEASSKTSI